MNDFRINIKLLSWLDVGLAKVPQRNTLVAFSVVFVACVVAPVCRGFFLRLRNRLNTNSTAS
ncbi:MAG: hypothetical protein K0U19_02910 [Proteobacteria bacterium]|nr:hypothetical protein [Pseudomonadota bacterium]